MNAHDLIESPIHRLSHVYRFSSIPVIRRESVAEHTVYVALYSMLLADVLQGNGIVIDYGKLLRRALVHDLDESMTGDFLRYVKYASPDLKKALDDVSIKMISKIERDLGVSISSDWKGAKSDDIEGHIIIVTDFLRVISYLVEEIKLGNRYCMPLLVECCGYLTKFIEEYHDSPLVEYARDIVTYAKHLHGRLSDESDS